MLELITAAHTSGSGNGTLDVPILLQRMDLCTCAAAEKHTRVQCVTASMGDVVLEAALPQMGDLLELTARPVYTTGRTSLDIALTVVAESWCGTSRRRTVVCEACFTYVTTKGPQGEKRLCPPIVVGGVQMEEQLEWEMKIAQHRKSLLSVEHNQFPRMQARTEGGSDDTTTTTDVVVPFFELTEVVLPAHQNHMGHTFGGVVMAWMAKAAMACALRLAQHHHLMIRAIVRVDFQCGSNVSDHLLLRPRPNAVFDGGRSAEIEVRVCKRSIATGEEIDMNVGYFFVSGARGPRMEDEEVIPFPPHAGGKDWEGACWRRRLLLARRQLLSGTGDVVEWHPSLHHEAPLLTIASVLRLVHHNDKGSVQWINVIEEAPETSATMSSSSSLLSDHVRSIEWTPGEAWGRNDTFVLRVKGILPGVRYLEEVLETIRSYRPGWDDFCVRVDIVEASSSSTTGDNAALQWDVVRHVAVTPKAAAQAREQVLGTENGVATVPLCLLRTWQIDPDEDTAIFASQSIGHADVAEVAAQVRPSGWFLRGGQEKEGIELTYIAEHDFRHLRRVCLGMKDEEIVAMLAGTATKWFQRLGSLMEC